MLICFFGVVAMGIMSMKRILLFACVSAFVTLKVCDAREIIMNENTLLDTCTKTCEEIPTLHLSSTGWNRGFVRCDYCRCTCNEDRNMKDIQVDTKLLSISEPSPIFLERVPLHATGEGWCERATGVFKKWETATRHATDGHAASSGAITARANVLTGRKLTSIRWRTFTTTWVLPIWKKVLQ